MTRGYRPLHARAIWLVGLVGPQILLGTLGTLLLANAVAATPRIGSSPRSDRLFDAAVVAFVVQVGCLIAATVVLFSLFRVAQHNLEAVGRHRIPRPSAIAYILLILPPLGVTAMVWHYGKHLYQASRSSTDDPTGTGSLKAWIITLLVGSVLGRVPTNNLEAGQSASYVAGALSPSLAATTAAGLLLARFVYELADRQEAISDSASPRSS